MATQARIAAIRQATPTVKAVTLEVADPGFGFLPGQWVDFLARIGGRTEVAGYSITSSPLRRGSIELAVKASGTNPVTHYIHHAARAGDRVEVEVGGTFYYQRPFGDALVLVAGGIGITPIMSILRYVDEGTSDVTADLLYSAATPSELLFGPEIAAMAGRNPRLRCVFTVTRPGGEAWDGRVGRVDAAMLRQRGRDPSAVYYLCGPPPMMADVVALLENAGVLRGRIRYEWWWAPEPDAPPHGGIR